VSGACGIWRATRRGPSL